MFDQPGARSADSGPPGSGLLSTLRSASARLAGVRPVAGQSAKELLDAVALTDQLVTQIQGLQARTLAALRMEPIETANIGYQSERIDPGPEVVTAYEVAHVLGVGIETARDRILTAQAAVRTLPSVLAAAEAGQLRWWQVRRTVDAVIPLDAVATGAVDQRIAAAARAGRCRSRFGQLLARAVLAAAPDNAEQHRLDALSERRIWFRPVDHGMTAFGGLIPAEGAITLGACLTRLAGTPLAQPPTTCDRQGRTLDQARADALTGLGEHLLDQLLAGTATTTSRSSTAATTPSAEQPQPDPLGRAALRRASRARRRADSDADRVAAAVTRMSGAGLLAPSQLAADAPSRVFGAPAPRTAGRLTGEIRVTVSADTLLGVSQAPGELEGYGPITAAHARYLAHRAGTTWRRVLTDPTSGTVLDIGRTRYRPPEALADLVRTRYGGRCTRPGCAHRAADLDHALDWKAGGDTSDSNLHPVCRGCHTAKHDSATTSQGWTITLHDDQSVTWTAPHGHSRTSYPTDHRPEDRIPVPVGAPPDPREFGPPDGHPPEWDPPPF